MNSLFNVSDAINQRFIKYKDADVTIHIKREDLLHDEVSGNKLRKLKYNLAYAMDHRFKTVLTYGGAYSNHIAATAAACKILGLKSIGIIRGEELGVNLKKTLGENETLRTAQNNGMRFHFISRDNYKDKTTTASQMYWKEKYPEAYIIPEGGTNDLAVKGTSEILTDADKMDYDIIAVAAGTGGTAAGIIESSGTHQHVLVFSALIGDFLIADIQKYTDRQNFTLYSEDAFGGYAKSSNVLIDFMNVRFRESGIPLDPIYTAKMMYSLEQMVQEGIFPAKTRILAVHTGGLQSIDGYNRRLKKKGRVQIAYEEHI